MANWYVYSGAAGAGTGADWTNAYTTLGAAATAKAAGDVFFVAHDHAETAGAAKSITFAGSEATPNRCYCVNRAGSVPPVSADLRTTATVTTTGNFSITVQGSGEVYGITFVAGSGASGNGNITMASANKSMRFVNCSFQLATTSATATISTGGGPGCGVFWENCTVKFGAAGQKINHGGVFVWKNTPSALVAGGTVPTNMIALSSFPNTLLEALDLSGFTGNLFSVALGVLSTVIMKDCKLASAATVCNVSIGTVYNTDIQVIRCDSGDTNYRTERYLYGGTLTTETTIVRTGGASDGVTTVAWKIVTTANSEWEFPFECLPIIFWNETIGSAITVTIQGIWGGGAVPTNADIWIDTEYLGTSGFPLGSKATSGKADGLATATNLTAGTGTWGGSTTKFAMSTTFTPQEKGPVTIYVRAALVSSTFYIDPKPVIT